MKKVFVSLCMASVLMGLSSCASTKNAATLSSINGEWNIIEVNGTAVVPAPGQNFPISVSTQRLEKYLAIVVATV